MDTKGEMSNNTVILGHFNTSLILMHRSSREKIYKEIGALNGTLDQMDLIYIFRAFQPKVADMHPYQVQMEHVLG